MKDVLTMVALLCISGVARGSSSARDRKNSPSQACATMPTDKPYHLVSKSSGLALSVAGESTAAGAAVMQSSASLATKLQFEPTNNNYYRLSVGHSDLAIGVKDSSLTKSGKIIQQEKTAATASTEWCFVAVSSGIYQIKNRTSGLVLEVGLNIHQGKPTGASNQLWSIGDDSASIADSRALQAGGTRSRWEGPTNTPVIAAAAANFPDGRILMWSAAQKIDYRNGGGKTWTAVYNPSTKKLASKLIDTNHDSSNSAATSFFNYQTNKWSIGPKMKITRGYHSMTLLADGSVFTCGGSWSGGRGGKDAEIWSPKTKTWNKLGGVKANRFLTNDKEGVYRSDNHFWLFLAPNGKVFHAGPSKRMHWVTTTGTGSVKNSVLRGNDKDAMNGNAVMFDVGKILTIGGAENYDSGSASNRAYVIDINGAEAKVTQTGSMQLKRTLHNSVLLASGEVIVVGGRAKIDADDGLFSDGDSRRRAEIWSPKTGKFQSLGVMKTPRNYHSVAILMKDGRVWVGGGGLCGTNCAANHANFEIFTPPYLFRSNGSLATRPVIQSAPGGVKAGGTFTVKMNTNQNHTFALVRIGAVTHSVNNDQRRIPLKVLKKNSSLITATFTLRLNGNKNVALAGSYYLFAMNQSGVPSVARSIRINL